MTRKVFFVLSMFALVLRPAEKAEAIGPTFWTTNSFSDFSRGTFRGLSLTADGQLSIAPKFDSVFDSDQALIWSAVYDAKNNLFVGTGHDGKVFKIDAKGSSSLFFDAPELDVLALALDAAMTLYVATSPDGRIYKVNAEGKATAFFDPEDKFIWDMSFNKKGELLVATGNKGRIYKINKDGKGEVLFDSGQTNLICMAIDEADNIIAGSDPDGYVYRISPDGKPFVLYDSAMREIHRIQIDSMGNLYFVAINGERASATSDTKNSATESIPGESVTISLSVSGPGEKRSSEETPTFKASNRAPAKDSNLGKSAIYRIAKDNSLQNLWSSDAETVYGLYVTQRGVMFSTGSKGKIYLLKPDKKPHLLLETTEEQTTRLLQAGPDLIACTSNLAKVYRLSTQLGLQGSYESEVRDAQGIATWGTLHWRASVPAGTSLKLYTRSGNTKKPDKTWSEWSKAYSSSDEEAIQSPRARYLQYKVALTTSNQQSPLLDEVSVPYLSQNFAPEVKSIAVLPTGVAYQRLPGLGAPRSPSSAVDQGSADASGASEAIPQTPNAIIPPRRIFQKGAQSFSWEADDPNGDDLSYSVYFRAEKQSEWRLLKKDLEERSFTLEADTLPDGEYVLKIVASDSPSNPKALSLSGDLTSAVFTIDNTAPTVQATAQSVELKRATVHFRALDAVSQLRRAECSIDGSDWETIFSADGIVDSKVEEFEVKTDDLIVGEHAVALRVFDSAGNVAIGKAVVSIK